MQHAPTISNVIAHVDGWPINIANLEQAVSEICSAGMREESFAAFTLNLDHIVKLRQDAGFRAAYSSARFVTADGAPIAHLASQSGVTVMRTTGADLVEPLAMEAARLGLPIYLFGTTPDALARSGSHLTEMTGHRLNIIGTSSPPFGLDPEGPIADRELERIRASGARLCLVAIGAPKQELFAARGIAKGITVGFVCVGAALDFLAGKQRRAPRVMQVNGLEWLWRLTTSPRRLSGRYARCALVLADILIRRQFRQLAMRYRS